MRVAVGHLRKRIEHGRADLDQTRRRHGYHRRDREAVAKAVIGRGTRGRPALVLTDTKPGRGARDRGEIGRDKPVCSDVAADPEQDEQCQSTKKNGVPRPRHDLDGDSSTEGGEAPTRA
jgi:hypothetical protein